MDGRELARRWYRAEVAPRLNGLRHAAALLGEGSEVLGFDDGVSRDHDFGARVQVLVDAPEEVGPLRDALADLPRVFERFDTARTTVEVTGGFFTDRLGVDPVRPLTTADWLLTPTQVLATLADGLVIHDPNRRLGSRIDHLRWYPDDLWRYVLAAGWLRVSQEQAFVGRTGGHGDDLGSRLVTGRLARDLVRLAFLVERRWAPYAKWLGAGFARLPIAETMAGPLARAVAATAWRDREAAMATAASRMLAATNALGLGEPVDPEPVGFHDRDIRVVRADDLVSALLAPITDDVLRQLLDRLDYRGDGIARLPGAIDQAVDTTDVLTHPDRCRAAAPMLGL